MILSRFMAMNSWSIRAPDGAVACHFARPKSSSLAPALVNMTLAGLQVAVNNPLPMRVVECLGNVDGVAQDLVGWQGERERRRAIVSPSSDMARCFVPWPSCRFDCSCRLI